MVLTRARHSVAIVMEYNDLFEDNCIDKCHLRMSDLGVIRHLIGDKLMNSHDENCTKILITGGGVFIGSNLVELLIKQQ